MGEQMRRVVLAGAALVGLSCGGGDVTTPSTGSLAITTSTSGPEPDVDGYVVAIDNGTEAAIPTSGTLQRADIQPGNHSIQLTGIAANCTAAGENPRSVSIPAGETVTVTFELTCSASSGSLQITAATSGVSPDADGYTITVDGAERGTLVASGTVTLGSVPPGTHSVGLTGVVDNCQVQGDNPRTITIVAGASTTVGFEIACSPPPAVTGSLKISTSTTGPAPDPDGYRFAIDGGAPHAIGLNATTTLGNLAAGNHTVQLSGLATNCTPAGANPRSAAISAGATAEVSFAITCTAAPLIAFTSVQSGQRFVFVVRPDGTGGMRLAAGSEPEWSPDGGKILLTRSNSTTFNGDLYVVNRDGSGEKNLINDWDVVTHRWAPDGSKIAALTESCEGACKGITYRVWVMQPDGSGRSTLTRDGGSPAWSPDGRKLAFADDVGYLYTIEADGSGPATRVSDQVFVWDDRVAWSPDGEVIAFRGWSPSEGSGVYFIHPDGTGLTSFSERSGADSIPAWSPDSRRLAFRVSGEIVVMNGDGTGRTTLTHGGINSGPRWSPDGTHIAFVRGTSATVSDVFVMSADGSSQTKISSNPGSYEPAWSP
jgi:Tol biopolymer transport system component